MYFNFNIMNTDIFLGTSIFISTHIILIQCYNCYGIYKKYTDWVYTHFIICIITHILCKESIILNTLFTLNYANAHGLIGIHGFYITTGYNLLKEFAFKISARYNIKKKPLYIYVLGDGIIHILPCLIIRNYKKNRIIVGYEGLNLSLIAWLCHITYVPTLQNWSLNPCNLYNVKQRKMWQIYLAWIILSSSYFLTGYHLYKIK